MRSPENERVIFALQAMYEEDDNSYIDQLLERLGLKAKQILERGSSVMDASSGPAGFLTGFIEGLAIGSGIAEGVWIDPEEIPNLPSDDELTHFMQLLSDNAQPFALHLANITTGLFPQDKKGHFQGAYCGFMPFYQKRLAGLGGIGVKYSHGSNYCKTYY